MIKLSAIFTVGLLSGIILGWLMWRLPVHGKRFVKRARRDLEDIHRILGMKDAPLRTMEEIAQDPGPKHLRVEDPWWGEFVTPEVAQQIKQEYICATRQQEQSPSARFTASFSGPTVNPHVPWQGSTMKIVRVCIPARSPGSGTSSTWATSPPRLSVAR